MPAGSASLSSAACRITISSSRSLTVVFASLTAAAGIAVLSIPLDYAPKLALLGLIAAVGGRALWRDRQLFAYRAIVGLELGSEGVIRFELSDGAHVEGRVLPDTTCWPWLVVLRFHIDGRDRAESCVLLPDSLSKESWRRLALWLRWDASASRA